MNGNIMGFHLKSYRYILFILIMLLLTSCSRATSVSYPIGSLLDVTAENGVADWNTASVLAQEQHDGFALANQDAGFEIVDFSEGNRKDDVQVAVRDMVEGQLENPKIDPVVAIFGATSNEGTTRAAALANFFNVPMLVPSTSGDNLLPSNNLWAFQLSAPNSAHAQYILGDVLTQQTLGSGLEGDFAPEVRIAILFEQNTYGETAAVATATAALQQELEIMVYEKFAATNPDPARLRELVNQVIDQDAQIIFLVSSQPDVARSLVKTFTDMLDPLSMPIMVGMAGGFTSQEFIDSPQAESVYLLSQQIDWNTCPAKVESLYEAQNYAAVLLLQYAVEEAPNLVTDKTTLTLSSDDGLAAYREAVRDALKAADLELPCLGQVAFDNSGHNKFAQPEILLVTNGRVRTVPAGEFIAAVKQKIGLVTSE